MLQWWKRKNNKGKYQKNNNRFNNKVGFATNVDRNSIHIKNVNSNSTNLHFVSIALKKDILQESAQRMKKDFTEKEVHALDVGQSGIL